MTTTVATSVVFTDLVGSTELASRLGPVGTEEVREVHFRLLRDAVAATGGTEVKNLGDGLMVVYPSLGGALDGAVAMQQNVERHNRTAAEPLGIRIGVSSGDTTEEDGDYFGEPVVEAARLCAKAEGGQIVTTDMVRMLARRSDHDFNSLGDMALKGLPEPVEAFEVRWLPAAEAPALPLPGRLAGRPGSGVVGRALEREQLLEALKGAASSEGRRIVLLSGEPGIGKTTLSSDLAQHANEEGMTVLYGRSDEDLGVPYQPFVEAFGDFVAHVPDAGLKAIDDRNLSDLSRLVPQVRTRRPEIAEPQSTDTDAERYLLFGAVTGTIADIASTAPLVLVIDDLHWADKPTVLLLRHLVATLDQAPVLIIGTFRDSDLTTGHPLTEGLAALRREPGVERMAITGLDDNGVIALLEGLAGHEMAADGIQLAHAVRRETDGNPFFTEEVVRHLAETGAIRQQDGRWEAAIDLSEIGLPESVREVVGQRVRRLGEEAHKILTVASVIGRDFDLGLLAQVAERDEDDVLDALEEATTAAVVTEVQGRSERFTFIHALFQHTLYDELSASRRARIHRRIGELLEAECGDDPGDRIGELARHWVAATRPEVGKAAAYSRRAGERALDALAPDEAIRWFQQTIELLDAEPEPDAHVRLDVLIGLGDAQRQAGVGDYRDTLLQAATEAIRLDDTDRLVAAVLVNRRGGWGSSAGTLDPERIANLEHALDAVGDADSRSRALLLATLSSELSFSDDLARRKASAAEAEAMARRLGDDVALLQVLYMTFVPTWLPDLLDRSVAVSEEALILADALGDPVGQFWAAQSRVQAMASSADRAGFEAAQELSDALAHEIGQPFLNWIVTYQRAWQALLFGDADEADRLTTEALQIGTDSGQPDAFTVYGASLVSITWHRGGFAEILPLVAQAAADNPGIPAFQAAHAVALCESGLFDDARPLLEAARENEFHQPVYDLTWLTNVCLWADVAASVGDTAAAELLFDQLAPFETQGVCPSASHLGTVGAFLARLAVVLGRDDDAQQLFENADAQLRSLNAVFWHARNQVEWARLLLTSGGADDIARAVDLLTEAQATADTFGCAAVEARARELLATLG